MFYQKLRFTGRELHFRFTVQFITLMGVRILEEINGKDKECNIKESELNLNSLVLYFLDF